MRLVIFILILFSISLNSKEVILNINHTINGQEIDLETIYQHDGVDFKFKRLQYFLSNFELIDQDDNVIKINDSYLLVNYLNTEYLIANTDIESIKKIRFYIGVDGEANHSDPTAYPFGHPLSIETSNMHWGWAYGYRFIALEGFVKDIFDSWRSEFSYHAVGNQYYSLMEFEIEAKEIDNKIIIDFNPDIIDLLDGVNITEDNIIHGSGGANDIIIQNMAQTEFFTDISSDIEDDILIKENNYIINNSTLIINDKFNSFRLYNINGNIVYSDNSNIYDLNNLDHGIYFIELSSNGETLLLEKFIK